MENLLNNDTQNTASPTLNMSQPMSASDVYAAPSTTPDIPTSSGTTRYDDSPWYATSGRIGRVQLLAYSFVWLVVFALLLIVMVALDNAIVYIALAIPVLISTVYLGLIIPKRRLHDLNRSGWFLLLAFVPIIQGLFQLYYTFAPGEEGFNDYGPPPKPYTKGHVALAATLPLLYVVGIVGAMIFAMSPYNSYLEEMTADEGMTIEEDVDASIEARMAEIEAQRQQDANQASTESMDMEMTGDDEFSVEWSNDDTMTESDAPNAVSIMNEAGNEPVEQQLATIEDNIVNNNVEAQQLIDSQAAMAEAVSEPEVMSLEEFMSSDSRIMVE